MKQVCGIAVKTEYTIQVLQWKFTTPVYLLCYIIVGTFYLCAMDRWLSSQ